MGFYNEISHGIFREEIRKPFKSLKINTNKNFNLINFYN